MTTGDQTFAERKVLAILDAWDKARNPRDPKWRQQYAQAAIAAGLPCHADTTGRDLGPDGWRAWANEVATNGK